MAMSPPLKEVLSGTTPSVTLKVQDQEYEPWAVLLCQVGLFLLQVTDSLMDRTAA